MRLERDQRITLLILAVMVALFVAADWAPRRVQAARLNARLATARAELASSPGTAKLASLSQSVTQLQAAAGDTRRNVPHEADLAGLLRLLTAEMEAVNVLDQEMQTQEIVPGSNYHVIPVTVQFRGSFDSAFTLLRKIEAMPRLVRPIRLRLQAGPPASAASRSAGADAAIRVAVDLSAFYAPSEETRR